MDPKDRINEYHARVNEKRRRIHEKQMAKKKAEEEMEAKVLSPKKKEKGEILDELENELERTKSKKKRTPIAAETDGEVG